jgi:tryptophan-rich sensory protein
LISDSLEKKMRSTKANAIGLAIFLSVCFLRFEVGSWVTATSVTTWYRSLQKASFNPPEGYFSPVWIVLYFLMAIAGWRIWSIGNSRAERVALVFFAVQLGLNMAWSVLFFGYQRVGLALAEMIVLLLTVMATTVLFWRIDRLSGLLLAPYLLWLGFATVLTTFIWRLN